MLVVESWSHLPLMACAKRLGIEKVCCDILRGVFGDSIIVKQGFGAQREGVPVG